MAAVRYSIGRRYLLTDASDMKTLHTAYRVSDLVRALDFYPKVGYREIGRVAVGDGALLVMLNLPSDGDAVTLELAYAPARPSVNLGTGFSHIAVQVDNLEATVAALAAQGVGCDAPQRPGGAHGPQTCVVRDPDGYRLGLVGWPAGHPTASPAPDFV